MEIRMLESNMGFIVLSDTYYILCLITRVSIDHTQQSNNVKAVSGSLKKRPSQWKWQEKLTASNRIRTHAVGMAAALFTQRLGPLSSLMSDKLKNGLIHVVALTTWMVFYLYSPVWRPNPNLCETITMTI